MVQFNLLPDVKLDYKKAQRTKQLTLLIATAVAAAALFIFVMLFFAVHVVQKQHISNLNKDIASKTQELESVADLDKVLTIQNQLGAMTGLHDQKPVTSRLYDYLIQLTPKAATIADVNVDFATNTITLNGTADSLVVVNKFADTLKFTEYQTGDNKIKPFTEVVLSSFGVSGAGGSEGQVTYSLTFKFDPVIFNSAQKGLLVVPKIISTRSVTEKPADLFKELPKTEGNQ